MAVTGAADTVGAEDDFGLIQGVSSLCPPLSPVPDIFGRIQEVSNCCPPFPPACITDRRAYVEVRLAELLFGSLRFHGFDDEAQDGLSLGVH